MLSDFSFWTDLRKSDCNPDGVNVIDMAVVESCCPWVVGTIHDPAVLFTSWRMVSKT